MYQKEIDQRKRWPLMALLVLIGSIFNALLQLLAEKLGVPIFLDSNFTIIIGALFGVIPGVLTGLLTNFLMDAFHHFSWLYLPFAVVNMGSGLLAGLWGKKQKQPEFANYMELLIWLTLLNTVLGALIVNFLYGGITGTSIDSIIKSLILTGQSLLSSSILGRLVINLADKSIAIFALILIKIIKKNLGEKSSKKLPA